MNWIFLGLPMNLDDLLEMCIPVQGEYTLLLIGGIGNQHYLHARRRVEGFTAERIFEQFLAGIPKTVPDRDRLSLFGEGLLIADAAHSRFVLTGFRGVGSYRKSPPIDVARSLLTEYVDQNFPGYSVRVE